MEDLSKPSTSMQQEEAVPGKRESDEVAGPKEKKSKPNVWKQDMWKQDDNQEEEAVPGKRESDEVAGPKEKKRKSNVWKQDMWKQDDNQEVFEAERQLRHGGLPFRKKKMAMMLMYSGKGYSGMQINPGVQTIEHAIMDALVKAGLVIEEHVAETNKIMKYQRAARTDKGVSAAGQLCSLKMFVDVEDPVKKMNEHLPAQIRVLAFKTVTKSFCSKNSCDFRSYMYMLPTFAFAPIKEIASADYRITSDITEKVNKTLQSFVGTHPFHNYSSGRKASEASSKRYITEFKCGAAFVQDGLELCVITVKGQSFILHQIRKMIGITIAIVRGCATEDVIEKTWQSQRVDVPKAPGLGLVLERTHYNWYNKKFGKDGVHDAIDWDHYKEEVLQFKKDYIYKEIIQTEREECSMLEWMSTLSKHSFDFIPEGTIEDSMRTDLFKASRVMHEARRWNQQNAEGISVEATSNLYENIDAQNSEGTDVKPTSIVGSTDAENIDNDTPKLNDNSRLQEENKPETNHVNDTKNDHKDIVLSDLKENGSSIPTGETKQTNLSQEKVQASDS